MTTPNPQPFYDAIRSAITTAGVACDIAQKPPAATTRWVILWPDPGTVTDRSMRSRDGFDLVIPLHAYGLSPEAAGFALRCARDVIQAQRGGTFGARHVQEPVNVVARSIDRDDDVDPPVFWFYDEWRIRTV